MHTKPVPGTPDLIRQAAVTILATMFLATCTVATNLDIREMAFPSEQSMDLSYRRTVQVYGETVSLPDVLDEESAWQIFTLYNKDTTNSIELGTISLETPAGFTLDVAALPTTLAPLESAEFRIKYFPAAPGTAETRLIIPYTIAERERTYMVLLQGIRQENNVPIIEIGDPDGVDLSNDGTGYDFGYASGQTVTRTFTITNSGQETLRVYSVYSSNDSALKVTDKPLANAAVSPGASTTFTVAMQSAYMETFSTAEVTVSTNAVSNSEFIINMAGGGSALPLTVTGDVGYRLDRHGYDFKWVGTSGSETNAITVTNSGTIPCTIPAANVTLSGSSTGTLRYAVQPIATEDLPAGVSTTVSVTASPVATEWSEADLVFRSDKGRSYTIRLMSSGFRQPDNLAGLSLWLRADKVRTSDIEPNGFGEYIVNRWPDSSGNEYDGIPPSPSVEKPKYRLEGINNLPSIEFNNNANTTNVMWARKDDNTPIVSGIDVEGLTIAIVFRTDSSAANNSNRYILQPFLNSSLSTNVFGQLYLEQSPTNYYRMRSGSYAYTTANLSGYEVTYVYAQDYTNAGKSIATNAVYSVVEAVDYTIARPQKNRYLVINGADKVLGDWPAYNATTWPWTYPGNFRNLDEQRKPDGSATNEHNNIRYYSLNPIVSNPSTYLKTIHSVYIGRIYQASEFIIFSSKLSPVEMGYLNTYFQNKLGVGTEP